MKIGIFGGSFDPWTPAHQAIVDTLLESGGVDQVMIVPTIVSYYRKSSGGWLTYEERLEVIREITSRSANRDKIVLNTCEIDTYLQTPDSVKDAYRGSRRFIHTLVDIRKAHLEDELFVVIGTDQAEKFEEWFEHEKICEIAKIIVVQGRDDKELNFDSHALRYFTAENNVYIPFEFRACSASEIREWYKGRTVSYYIDHFGERLIWRTPIFDLVDKPDDGSIGFRPVGVNSPDWCCIAVEKNGMWLMVSQLRYGQMRRCVEFPSGIIEPGEDPLSAALRELEEETGVVISDRSDVVGLGRHAANPAFMDNYMHYFYVNLDSAPYSMTEPRPDDSEKLSVEWRPKSEVIAGLDGNSVFMTGIIYKLNEKLETKD